LPNLNWHRLRFLESDANLKPLLKIHTGRNPATAMVREVTACLQQGRFYYDAAFNSPLEIRPLLMFYGLVAFSRAIVIARTHRRLSTLSHAHGLADTSAQGCRLRDLQVRVLRAGTFQTFNDVARELSRVCYFRDGDNKPLAIPTPSAASSDLAGSRWTLQSLVSRVPGLEDIYRLTFAEDANTMSIAFFTERDTAELRIHEEKLIPDRDTLKTLIQRLRDRYPFLNQWRFASARPEWGYSVLTFVNTPNAGVDEFGASGLRGVNEGFVAAGPYKGPPTIPFASILPPMGGGFTEGHPQAISPLNGLTPSEFSLDYLVLFLLSSLVRYRPDTWSHALSRSVTENNPADDQAVSLIERFLELHVARILPLVVTALNPWEDKYR
jgi:hypothetical protein